ncbi:MAG: hypothetical protein CVU45_05665, partial [Chloroflexi bacterium HGW-Chloroflexi-7]
YTPAKVTAAPELVTAYAVSPAVSMDIPEAYDEYPPQDKRPFMNMDTAPVCPACGVPMILHSEKRLLFKPKEEYICQNAPSCPETMPLE